MTAEIYVDIEERLLLRRRRSVKGSFGEIAF
jgi:hypothetical protein